MIQQISLFHKTKNTTSFKVIKGYFQWYRITLYIPVTSGIFDSTMKYDTFRIHL